MSRFRHLAYTPSSAGPIIQMGSSFSQLKEAVYDQTALNYGAGTIFRQEEKVNQGLWYSVFFHNKSIVPYDGVIVNWDERMNDLYFCVKPKHINGVISYKKEDMICRVLHDFPNLIRFIKQECNSLFQYSKVGPYSTLFYKGYYDPIFFPDAVAIYLY